MVIAEATILAKPAFRFPVHSDDFLDDVFYLDEFSDKHGTSRFLLGYLDESVRINISSTHLEKMFDYLDYKLELPTCSKDFNVVMWQPEEKKERFFSMYIDDMKLDSEIFWNSLLAICERD